MDLSDISPTYRNKNLLELQHPCRAIICAASGHGKTHWLVNQLLSPDAPWESVVIFCHDVSIDQPVYQHLKRNHPDVTFYSGLPETEEEEQSVLNHLAKQRGKGKQTAVVVDDLMEECASGRAKKFVSKLYTSGRHLNCSVFQLLQRLMHDRSNRLNCEYLIAGATPADVGSLAAIARQISPEDHGRAIMACYRQATAKPHGFLIIDLKSGDPRLRLRDTELDTAFDVDKISDVAK